MLSQKYIFPFFFFFFLSYLRRRVQTTFPWGWNKDEELWGRKAGIYIAYFFFLPSPIEWSVGISSGVKRWLINFYSPPGATALDKEKPLILLVLYKCASSCGCWARHKPDRGFMNDARVGKSRRCESVNTVPLLLHFFFFPFFLSFCS